MSIAVGSSGSGIQIDPEGFDMSAQPSKPTGGYYIATSIKILISMHSKLSPHPNYCIMMPYLAKRGHGDDEVDARPTNDVKIPKPSAGMC